MEAETAQRRDHLGVSVRRPCASGRPSQKRSCECSASGAADAIRDQACMMNNPLPRSTALSSFLVSKSFMHSAAIIRRGQLCEEDGRYFAPEPMTDVISRFRKPPRKTLRRVRRNIRLRGRACLFWFRTSQTGRTENGPLTARTATRRNPSHASCRHGVAAEDKDA